MTILWVMRSTVRSVLTIAIVFTVVIPVASRDFMERPEGIVPGDTPDGFTVLPSIYTEVAYHHHTFLSGRNDSFQIRNTAHAGLVDLGTTRIGLYYGTYLLSGPVDDPDAQGSDLAPWLMNAVQFEYGLTARWSIASLDVVADYGRRSYHRLREGFSDPSSDIVRAGFADRAVPMGREGTIDWAIRLRWSRLFEFWGTGIAQPRVTWAVQPAIEYRRSLAYSGQVGLDLFLAAMGDLFVVAGAPDADLAAEAGFSITPGTPGRRIDLFLDAYRSPDTEELIDREYSLTVLGLAFRVIFDL
ncbi:MAG: hypothetical protein ACLFR8_01705 [Alkalispirochaeta sp.]